MIAPWARHADFVVVTQGDGAGATLLRGWEALCEFFVSCHYHDPDVEQRGEVMARLTDWEAWSRAADNLPYYLHCSYEDGNISVFRLTDAAQTDHHPSHEALVDLIQLWSEHEALSGGGPGWQERFRAALNVAHELTRREP